MNANQPNQISSTDRRTPTSLDCFELTLDAALADARENHVAPSALLAVIDRYRRTLLLDTLDRDGNDSDRVPTHRWQADYARIALRRETCDHDFRFVEIHDNEVRYRCDRPGCGKRRVEALEAPR